MCEPENRLVARNLERHWEEKLRAVEQVEKEFEVWRKQHHTVLTDEDRQRILALGENLPKLWSAPSTTNADRKQIIRLVIKDVVLDRTRKPGKVWIKINWQNGATILHMRTLWRIRAHWQCEEGHNPQQWDDGTYSIQGAAMAIGVRELTIHSWLRRGLLEGKQPAKGRPWKIPLTEEQISSLRECADRARPGRRRQ